MNSGIYKLTFADGSMYVGKSIDIDRRWNEHINKFNKGTAAKNLQHKFNIYGMPNFSVLHECHSDHIDLLESVYIDMYWGDLLNTTRTNLVPDEEKMFLLKSAHTLAFSTIDHIRALNNTIEEVEHLTNKIEEILNRDEYIKSLIQEKIDLEYENEFNKQEIIRLKNRNIFERILNT